jgi:hypothetical protein
VSLVLSHTHASTFFSNHLCPETECSIINYCKLYVQKTRNILMINKRSRAAVYVIRHLAGQEGRHIVPAAANKSWTPASTARKATRTAHSFHIATLKVMLQPLGEWRHVIAACNSRRKAKIKRQSSNDNNNNNEIFVVLIRKIKISSHNSRRQHEYKQESDNATQRKSPRPIW